MRHRFLIRLALLMAGAVAASAARAQAAAGNPLDTLPAIPQFKQDAVPAHITAPPSALQQLLATSITPTRFDIEGVRSIPFAQVAALFAPLARQATTVGRLIELTREVTELYRQRGYALSFCYVPNQDFKDGVVRIVAVEGHVSEVRIEGDAGKAEPKIRAMSERIRRDKPLRQQTFDRYVRLLGELPGVQMQASAPLPVNTDGATVLSLKVSRKPYAMSLGMDSRQSQPRLLVTGVLNDPFIAGGQLGASTILSAINGEKYYAFQYTQFIGSQGLNLKLEVSQYQGDPDALLGLASATARQVTSNRVELTANYPLVLTKTRSLVASGGVYGVNYTDAYLNPATAATLAYETRSRTVFGQLSYAISRPDQVRRASLLLARGVNDWGARADASTNVPGLMAVNSTTLNFTRLLFQASQSDSWPARFGSALSMTAQYSHDVLPAAERISFGGLRFARGYAAGETSGDSGWGLGLEINRSYPVDLLGVKQLQPYLLLEAARVYNTVGVPVPARLSSVALGSRLSDLHAYSLDVALAKPTGEMPLENPGRNLRLSASLTYRLGVQ